MGLVEKLGKESYSNSIHPLGTVDVFTNFYGVIMVVLEKKVR